MVTLFKEAEKESVASAAYLQLSTEADQLNLLLMRQEDSSLIYS